MPVKVSTSPAAMYSMVATSLPPNECDWDDILDAIELEEELSRFVTKKRQKQRVKMAKFRRSRKQKQSLTLVEYQHLRRTMDNYADTLKKETSSCGVSTSSAQTSKLLALGVEMDVLRCQNVALGMEIKRHQAYQKLLLAPKVLDGVKAEEESLLVSSEQPGWWVRFRNGEPPFFFHQFSIEQIKSTPDPFDSRFQTVFPPVCLVGELLGWKVYRAPAPPDVTTKSGVPLHVRFVKRFLCSIDTVMSVSFAKERDVCPILWTPMGWGCGQRHNVSTQLLQEIDEDTRLSVHSILGPTNVRYMFLTRHELTLIRGKRKLAASMVVADSKANQRGRDVNNMLDDAKWVSEGGACVTMTEVGEEATDIVYDHWGDCDSKLHADYLLAQWTQFVVGWEQAVVPSKLLTS